MTRKTGGRSILTKRTSDQEIQKFLLVQTIVEAKQVSKHNDNVGESNSFIHRHSNHTQFGIERSEAKMWPLGSD